MIKPAITITVVLSLIGTACQTSKKETAETAEKPLAVPPSLRMKWETDTLLTTCESVLYDPGKDILYVSSINGASDAKDGNGFISKVNLDGGITELKWATGLDAPKGLGFYNNHLYVTDLDRVVEIDAETGKIVKAYPVKGSVFLNDITVDRNGNVFASDSRAGLIVKIADGKAEIWMDGLDGPNGLLAEDGHLMTAITNSKTLNSIDLMSKELTLKADSLERPDGVEAVGDGTYLVSSWTGMVHLVDAKGNTTLLLDTRDMETNAADIEYIQEKNLLVVPTFFKNKVVAYELTK
jgi:hypothetical protein